MIFARVDEDQESVARQIGKYDLIAIPVVDASDMLVGIITHDDAMDILRQEQTEDILAFGGVSKDAEANEESYWQGPDHRGGPPPDRLAPAAVRRRDDHAASSSTRSTGSGNGSRRSTSTPSSPADRDRRATPGARPSARSSAAWPWARSSSGDTLRVLRPRGADRAATSACLLGRHRLLLHLAGRSATAQSSPR